MKISRLVAVLALAAFATALSARATDTKTAAPMPAPAKAAPAAAAKPAATPAKVDAKAAIAAVEKEFVAAWNVHDAKRMAAVWATNGDLINPFGRVAKGRAEIEKLFVDEQSTVFKGSTYTIDSDSVRQLSASTAIVDWESEVTGMTGPDGAAAPPFKHHVTFVYREVGGQWHVEAARPVVYVTPPAPPAAAPAH